MEQNCLTIGEMGEAGAELCWCIGVISNTMPATEPGALFTTTFLT